MIGRAEAVGFRSDSGSGNSCPQSGQWRNLAKITDRHCGQVLTGASPFPLREGSSGRIIRIDAVDGTMPLDVSGKVQHKAVVFARRIPHASAGHLHIEDCGLRRTQEGDQIDAGVIEAGSQDVAVGDRPQPPGFEFAEDVVPLEVLVSPVTVSAAMPCSRKTSRM